MSGHDELEDAHAEGCGPAGMHDPDRVTADGGVDALVLFADVDFSDPVAVAEREAEWRELLG